MYVKKVKVAHTRLPSIGFWSWSWLLAVSLQVTWVINPAVGWLAFHQACSYHRNPLEGCHQSHCLVNRGTMGVNSLPYLIHRDCDLNPGPSAPESSTLTARLPSMYIYAYVCVRAVWHWLLVFALRFHLNLHFFLCSAQTQRLLVIIAHCNSKGQRVPYLLVTNPYLYDTWPVSPETSGYFSTVGHHCPLTSTKLFHWW